MISYVFAHVDFFKHTPSPFESSPLGAGGGALQEYGFIRYKQLYIQQINNKDLLYSTGSYGQSRNNLSWSIIFKK